MVSKSVFTFKLLIVGALISGAQQAMATEQPMLGVIIKDVTLRDHKGLGWAADFSLNGLYMLTVSKVDHRACVWNAHSGSLVSTIRKVISASFSPDGTEIGAGVLVRQPRRNGASSRS